MYLFKIIPTGFLPIEDQGRFNINVEAAEGIGFDEMTRQHARGRRDRRARIRTSRRSRINIGSATGALHATTGASTST